MQVFDTPQTLITDIVNLLVVSNKYAKIYVVAGTGNIMKIKQLKFDCRINQLPLYCFTDEGTNVNDLVLLHVPSSYFLRVG